MRVVDYQHLDSYPPCQKQFCCPACRKSWVLRDGQGNVSAGDLNIPHHRPVAAVASTCGMLAMRGALVRVYKCIYTRMQTNKY